VSIAGDDGEDMVTDIMTSMSLDGEAAAEFRAVATRMVERHKELFPALHAELRRMRAIAGD